MNRKPTDVLFPVPKFGFQTDPFMDTLIEEIMKTQDWWLIPMHCKECGEQFFRKVKAQIYCDAHRHLGGSPVKLKADWDINEDGPEYVG